jgi:Protein of unknown function (DUF3631)
VWRPLLAVADAAGEDWLRRAQEALETLGSTARTDTASEGVLLLADIHRVFNERGVSRIRSKELAAALMEIEESPWGDWDGDPTRPLARLLKPYEIEPKTIKFGSKPLNGYLRKSFEEPWRRLLGEYEPPERADPAPSAPEEPTRRRGRWRRFIGRAGPKPAPTGSRLPP